MREYEASASLFAESRAKRSELQDALKEHEGDLKALRQEMDVQVGRPDGRAHHQLLRATAGPLAAYVCRDWRCRLRLAPCFCVLLLAIACHSQLCGLGLDGPAAHSTADLLPMRNPISPVPQPPFPWPSCSARS